MPNVFDFDHGKITINTVTSDLTSTGDEVNGGTHFTQKDICGKLTITTPVNGYRIVLNNATGTKTYCDFTCSNSAPQEEIDLGYMDEGMSIGTLSANMTAIINLYHKDLWRIRK